MLVRMCKGLSNRVWNGLDVLDFSRESIIKSPKVDNRTAVRLSIGW